MITIDKWRWRRGMFICWLFAHAVKSILLIVVECGRALERFYIILIQLQIHHDFEIVRADVYRIGLRCISIRNYETILDFYHFTQISPERKFPKSVPEGFPQRVKRSHTKNEPNNEIGKECVNRKPERARARIMNGHSSRSHILFSVRRIHFYV